MNKLLTYIALFSFLCLQLSIGAQTNEIEKIKALTKNTVKQITDQRGFSTLSFFLNNFMGHDDDCSFNQLLCVMNENWKIAISNLDYVAPSDIEKAILLYSCSSLYKEAYIELLKNLTQLTENGELNSEIYYSVQNPYNEQSDAWSVLAKEYQNPDVIDIIERSKVIFKDRPERLEFYNNILSGDNSRQIQEFEMRMYGKTNPFNKTELGRVDEEVPDNQKTVMWFFCTGVLGVIIACIALIVFRLK
ncbi:MAG: hypothetical protein PHY48_13100 [Candidatus Cloacimonetes bacterium]|nr:hypothetical protein [Candidatus Cloacimonadota bacterium]